MAESNSNTNVLFDLWFVLRAMGGVLEAALAEVELTADEFGLYSVLAAAESMTPSELAHDISAPATTVSSQLKRAEARGHLTRERNPNDGRSHVLRLTPSGRRAHRKAAEAFMPALASVEAALGKQGPAIQRSLATLRRAFESVQAELRD
jgi:DNA-binding MarR family transcriptional regulator